MSAEGWTRLLWLFVAALWLSNAITLFVLSIFVGMVDGWKLRAFAALETAEKLAERVRALEGENRS